MMNVDKILRIDPTKDAISFVVNVLVGVEQILVILFVEPLWDYCQIDVI